MGLRLVNSVPGDLADPLRPGEPVHLGLKSETGEVELGTLRVSMGLSSLVLGSSLPDEDPELKSKGAQVVLETVERRRPIDGAVQASLDGGQLLLLKPDDSDNDRCVYEVKIPLLERTSVLGYFRFRKAPWTGFSPDWCDLTQMMGPYFALEHGIYGTGIHAFLRDNGADGSLVVGGPLQAFGDARPGQHELPFAWTPLADNTIIELFLFFNLLGHPPPFAPSYTPVVEIWTRRIGVDDSPVVQAQLPIGSIGTYPTSGQYNARPQTDRYATLFFGNAGRSGDLLTLDDFALYPDFRIAVNQGVAMPSSRLFVLPDAPVVYRGDLGKRPEEVVPGRWLPTRSPGSYSPSSAIKYRSGQNKVPRHLFITKKASGRTAYFKKEPRLEVNAPVSSLDGAMIEAFMSGSSEVNSGDCFGAGIAIDDGSKHYRVQMLGNQLRRTYGLLRDSSEQSLFSGHTLPPSDIDYQSMKLVRLTVDRRRGRVAVDVDESRLIDEPIGGPFPDADDDVGKVMFGHIFAGGTKGRMDVSFVNYLSRYLAYESTDGLPGVAPVAFTEDVAGDASGASEIVEGGLQIKKSSFNEAGSKRAFSRAHDFYDTGGFLVDFYARVRDYTDMHGTPFSAKTSTGAGLTVFLGNKRVQLLFVDCGIAGKKIAIVPGSGSLEDIIEQTLLGQAFSGSVDWSKDERYRIVYKAYDKIEVWATSMVTKPLISIPWRNNTDGFDLPADGTIPSIQFGHFDELTASRTSWSYVRWGSANGFEVAVQPELQSLPPYLFGGKALVLSEFDE